MQLSEAESRPVAGRLFEGEGEMAALMRKHPWASTPLGPPDFWPSSLRMMVRLLLANRFPLLLWWGPQYVSLYNDAYRPILGAKHPNALGLPVSECWSEIWHILKPLIDAPFHGGPATWNDDICLEINRHGFVEETHFTIAYSPVPDDTVPSGIGGVLATVHEITDKVVAKRRVTALRDLGARVSEAKTAETACAIAAETLVAHARDIPFLLLYLLDADGTHARLAGTTDSGMGAAVSPPIVDLRAATEHGWPIAEAVRSERLQIVEGLHQRFPTLTPGPWAEPPLTAVVMPIPSNKAHEFVGVMIAGVSARLALDEYYRDFLSLVRTQVATAIANAREYEQERTRAEALADIDRAKTMFFSNVSHEFRTPLTLMLGPTEDALASSDRALTGESLETLYRNELRLLKLVNALLDFSRIGAARMAPQYEPVDLAAITSELASTFRSAMERAGLRYVVACDALTAPAYVDRDMWEQIVFNLLSNALKFTFEGTIEVRLREDGNRVALTVADTGVGIAPADIARLFERFHRVEGARSRTHEGSGIGLALAHDLVRLQGGTIEVGSVPGAGTTFTVVMPKGIQHLQALPPSSVTTPSLGRRSTMFVEEALRWLPDDKNPAPGVVKAGDTATTAHGLKHVPGRVLVAEDNADMRRYLTRLLAAHWSVEAVADGHAALDAIQQRPPDLVLSDVMMPGLDGFELLRAIRTDDRLSEIPVVLLSARAGEEARVGGLQSGADEYLTKPFAARELLARVNAQMTLARNRRERDQLLANEQAARRDADVQKQHLFSLFMQAPLPIMLLRGPEYVIEAANPLACRVWGRSHDLVINRPLFDALPDLQAQGVRERLDDVYRTGMPYVGNEILTIFDPEGTGTVRTGYLNFVYTPFRDAAGDIDGVFVVASEVTDQVHARRAVQQAQDRLNFALEEAHVGYWDLDLATLSATRSLSHDRIFGYASLLPEWTIDIFLAHIEDTDRPRVAELFRRAVATGEDWRFECAIVAADATRRWIAGNGRIDRAPGGGPGRMLVVIVDVTERRLALEREQEARAHADAASRAKDDFLAMLGHELRNPLAPIFTALQLMQMKDTGNAAKERAVIERQVTHVVRLVDDLLDVSRITTGKIEIKKEYVELADVVAKAIEMASPLLEQRMHAVNVDVPREGLIVHGDPMRLAQVVSNLLTNAAKYTEAKGRVAVRAEREGREVVLHVRDTGMGISPDLLPHIFEMFVQGRQSSDRAQGGLGLGLTIVQSLVALHHGRVSVESEGLGRGTEFVVRLPAVDRSVIGKQRPRPAPATKRKPAPHHRLRILVVDDNEDAAEMLATALSAKGHDVRTARDGPAALRMCVDFRPGVALLDIGLPVMDGYELAERLRALQGMEQLRLVAVTGYGQETDRRRSHAARFDAHIVKPVDLDTLDGVMSQQ